MENILSWLECIQYGGEGGRYGCKCQRVDIYNNIFGIVIRTHAKEIVLHASGTTEAM